MTDPALIACGTVLAVTVTMQFAFIGYLVIGGFLAWRWPRSIWLHVVVVVLWVLSAWGSPIGGHLRFS
jgi:uncharacterized membrane protein